MKVVLILAIFLGLLLIIVVGFYPFRTDKSLTLKQFIFGKKKVPVKEEVPVLKTEAETKPYPEFPADMAPIG